MIQPIVKIRSLLSDEVVTLFGDSVINNAYDEAMKFGLSLLTNKSILEALADSVDSIQISTQWTTTTQTEWETAGFMRKRRMLKVERNISGTTVFYEATQVNFLNRDKFENSSSIYYENNRYKPKWKHIKKNKIR